MESNDPHGGQGLVWERDMVRVGVKFEIKNTSETIYNSISSVSLKIFRKLEGVVGTGWSWLRIGTGGGHLWVR